MMRLVHIFSGTFSHHTISMPFAAHCTHFASSSNYLFVFILIIYVYCVCHVCLFTHSVRHRSVILTTATFSAVELHIDRHHTLLHSCIRRAGYDSRFLCFLIPPITCVCILDAHALLSHHSTHSCVHYLRLTGVAILHATVFSAAPLSACRLFRILSRVLIIFHCTGISVFCHAPAASIRCAYQTRSFPVALRVLPNKRTDFCVAHRTPLRLPLMISATSHSLLEHLRIPSSRSTCRRCSFPLGVPGMLQTCFVLFSCTEPG